MIRPFTIVFIFASLLFLFPACKKTTQNELINGAWTVTQVLVDTSSANYLNQLPYFTNGANCCNYQFDFSDNNVVFAYYQTYDTFNYISAGYWMLPNYKEVTIKLDNFMDGTFNITKPSPQHWVLTSMTNHIKAFDGSNSPFDTCFTQIKMQKN